MDESLATEGALTQISTIEYLSLVTAFFKTLSISI